MTIISPMFISLIQVQKAFFNRIFLIRASLLTFMVLVFSDTLVWKELKTSGQLLTPRAGHVTVALERNLIVFGGFTNSQYLYDDLYVLDLGM